MRNRLFFTLLCVAALAGCSPDDSSGSDNAAKLVAKEFTVTSDPDCGTWNEGDSIAVVDALGPHVFVAQSSGSEVLFSGEASASSTRRYAVSPVSSFVSYDKIDVKLRVPSQQSGFVPVCAAKASGDVFSMKQVSSTLSLTLTSGKVRKITIEGSSSEALSGIFKLSYSASSQDPSCTVAEKTGGIVVLPGNGGQFFEAGLVKVSCLPVKIASGVDVTLEYPDGFTKTFAVNVSSELKPGSVLDLGDVESNLESKRIDLSFYTGSFHWPFEKPASGELGSSFNANVAPFVNQETELVMPQSEGGYVFKAYSSNGLVKNTSQGFRFGAGDGNYLELPSIDGMYLTQVRIVTGSALTSLMVCTKGGTPVRGGQVACSFGAAGDEFTWTLYETQRSTPYRLYVVDAASIGIRGISLRYDYFLPEIPSGGVKIAEEIAGASSGEERYNALYNAHVKALAIGIDPDYTGVGTVELTVPASPRTIPLGRNNDFKGTVFKVRDDASDICLFSMMNAASQVEVTGKNIDNADYSSVPKLRSGTYILRVQDDSLWVANREGHNYGATRRDAILVKDGKGSCEPCYSYSTSATRLNCSYCETDDEQKTFCNVSLIRDPLSTKKIYLLTASFQNNLKISNVYVKTPQDNDWDGDRVISISNSTNLLCEDLTFDGTYSQNESFGYGLSCNCLWNSTFRRLVSHSRWGVFGCNNMHDSFLVDSDCERFDIHCYGKNITVRNSTLTGRGIPVSSVFGTILLEDSKFVDSYLYSTRTDYNAYVPFNLVIRNCEVTPKGTALTSMGFLDKKVNTRPELAKKCWPNVKIEGLKVNVPYGYYGLYLLSSYPNELDGPVGNLSEISISDLEFKYQTGSPTAGLYISQQKVKTEGKFTFSLKNIKMSSASGSSPAKVYVNIEGNPGSYSADADSDVKIVE